MHGWVFGCDVCQDVCPWNRKAPAGRASEFAARSDWTNPDLIEWLDRDVNTWKARLGGTALTRAKRVGLVRNAALVLGDRRVVEAVTALGRRLADLEEDPVVRSAAAWALGRIETDDAIEILRQNQRAADALVREAVARALANPGTDNEHEATGQAC